MLPCYSVTALRSFKAVEAAHGVADVPSTDGVTCRIALGLNIDAVDGERHLVNDAINAPVARSPYERLGDIHNDRRSSPR